MPQPPYFQLFERLLAFATEARFSEELKSARALYVRATGESFEEDASFETRAQAFLDWYVFDRRLGTTEQVPASLFADSPEGAPYARELGLWARTTHGLFTVEGVGRGGRVDVSNVVTGAEYRVQDSFDGARAGDFFEARLVPWEGRLVFSPAFLFHPREILGRFRKSLVKARKGRYLAGVQELTWMLARMASRAEHYPRMQRDAVYDFERPPPMLERPVLIQPRHRSE